MKVPASENIGLRIFLCLMSWLKLGQKEADEIPRRELMKEFRKKNLLTFLFESGGLTVWRWSQKESNISRGRKNTGHKWTLSFKVTISPGPSKPLWLILYLQCILFLKKTIPKIIHAKKKIRVCHSAIPLSNNQELKYREISNDNRSSVMVKLLNCPLLYFAYLYNKITPSLPIAKTSGEDQTRTFNCSTNIYQEPTTCYVQS
jgi:hypothetical protein